MLRPWAKVYSPCPAGLICTITTACTVNGDGNLIGWREVRRVPCTFLKTGELNGWVITSQVGWVEATLRQIGSRRNSARHDGLWKYKMMVSSSDVRFVGLRSGRNLIYGELNEFRINSSVCKWAGTK